MSRIDINNSKDSSVGGSWSNPGASLYDRLMAAPNWQALIRETYLIAPLNKIKNTERDETSFSASGVGYPHHVIRNGELVIHRGGLRAAYSRAAQQGIISGDVEAHLVRHYKELEWYEESNISGEEAKHGAMNNSVKMEEEIASKDDSLKHYGILGMRWGVRRYRGSDGRIVEGKYMAPERAAQLRKEGASTPMITSPSAAPKTSTEHKIARELRNTPIREMSNQQLQAYVQRMNLERTYKDIASKDVSAGKRFVNGLIKEAGNMGKELVRDIAKSKIRDIAVDQGLLPHPKKKGGGGS